jgi:DNA (cytosine-5)-methyltransferase 1
MKRAKRSDHTKRYGRLRWEGLASTILTKCDPHWGAYFHPDQDRTLTVREAARLQSFPDWFEFKGSRTDQYVQVGNAVPPLLGRAIAEAISKVVEEAAPERVLVAAE